MFDFFGGGWGGGFGVYSLGFRVYSLRVLLWYPTQYGPCKMRRVNDLDLRR